MKERVLVVVKYLNVILKNENMIYFFGLMSLNFIVSKLEIDIYYFMVKYCIKLLNINYMLEFIVYLQIGNIVEDVVLDQFIGVFF